MSSVGFSDYLTLKGMDNDVARSISKALGFTRMTQLRVVNEVVIQDIKEGCYGDLVLSEYHLDELRKIRRIYLDEHNGCSGASK